MENYFKTQSNGTAISQLANDGEGATIKTISAATTLTAADSGKTCILSAATGAQVTLPAVSSGLKYRFVVGLAFATTAWTVVAASKVIQGTVIVNGSGVNGANEDIITFAHAAETVGDWVEIVSDGTNWYVSGLAYAAGGITLTAST